MAHHRYLNIKYETGSITEVNITAATSFSSVQDAFKKKYGSSLPLDRAKIKLYDKNHLEINDLNHLTDGYYKGVSQCGLVLTIHTAPPAPREATVHASYKPRFLNNCLISWMTEHFKAFKSAQFVGGCIFSASQTLLP
ncbi:hypothetical protein BJ741DRAFT_394523 [Chytriomyces cf. hyalinus JEL632]|nr:hypothetical protein BJ741DRAFT_394523 [Chytriomyces cf. hyalinus JEL632]